MAQWGVSWALLFAAAVLLLQYHTKIPVLPLAAVTPRDGGKPPRAEIFDLTGRGRDIRLPCRAELIYAATPCEGKCDALVRPNRRSGTTVRRRPSRTTATIRRSCPLPPFPRQRQTSRKAGTQSHGPRRDNAAAARLPKGHVSSPRVARHGPQGPARGKRRCVFRSSARGCHAGRGCRHVALHPWQLVTRFQEAVSTALKNRLLRLHMGRFS